jgi:hypothetical protein
MFEGAVRRQFACNACGSPSVLPPATLEENALVHCGGCGACIGTWQEFKHRAGRAILAETDAAPPSALLSSDPLPKIGS